MNPHFSHGSSYRFVSDIVIILAISSINQNLGAVNQTCECIKLFRFRYAISMKITSSISLPISYQKNKAGFFRNGMVLLVCYPPISFFLDQECSADWNREGNKLNSVHVSTMHAQTIQLVQSSSSHSNRVCMQGYHYSNFMQHRYICLL